MIIVGLDVAIRCTGYGVLDVRSLSQMNIIDCGVIKNKSTMLHSECLRRITGGVRQIVEHFSPDTASIENAFYDKNIKTAMILSLARGAAMSVLAENDVTIYEYSPKEVKKSVVGLGTATKGQIAVVLSSLLNLEITDIPHDATDAVAMAVCHSQIAMRPELKFLLPNPI